MGTRREGQQLCALRAGDISLADCSSYCNLSCVIVEHHLWFIPHSPTCNLCPPGICATIAPGPPRAERSCGWLHTHPALICFPGSLEMCSPVTQSVVSMRSFSTNRCEPLLQTSIYDLQYLPTNGDNEPHFETTGGFRKGREKLHLHYNSPWEISLFQSSLMTEWFLLCIHMHLLASPIFSVSVHGKGNWTLRGCTHTIRSIYLFYLSSRL